MCIEHKLELIDFKVVWPRGIYAVPWDDPGQRVYCDGYFLPLDIFLSDVVVKGFYEKRLQSGWAMCELLLKNGLKRLLVGAEGTISSIDKVVSHFQYCCNSVQSQ